MKTALMPIRRDQLGLTKGEFRAYCFMHLCGKHAGESGYVETNGPNDLRGRSLMRACKLEEDTAGEILGGLYKSGCVKKVLQKDTSLGTIYLLPPMEGVTYAEVDVSKGLKCYIKEAPKEAVSVWLALTLGMRLESPVEELSGMLGLPEHHVRDAYPWLMKNELIRERIVKDGRASYKWVSVT